MAQSTASLVLLLFAAVLALRNERLVAVGRVLISAAGVLALVFAWQNRTGTGDSLEHLFWPDETHVWMRDGQRAGHISPFTAVGLAILAGVWLLASTSIWSQRGAVRVTSWVLSTTVLFFSAYLIGVHVVGTPLLHDWTYSSVTIADLLALIALSIAALAHTRAARGVSDSVLASGSCATAMRVWPWFRWRSR